VFFLAVPANLLSGDEGRVREGASEMVAYRAGRVPRYYVICPTLARASFLDQPHKRILAQSSIG